MALGFALKRKQSLTTATNPKERNRINTNCWKVGNGKHVLFLFETTATLIFKREKEKKKECVLLEAIYLPGSSMRSCSNFFTLTTSYQNSNKLFFNF